VSLQLLLYRILTYEKDSYTDDGKHDGSTPAAPVLSGDSPRAGGRATNGLTWVEDLAADANATIMDYAVSGAVVNVTLWPSKSTASDFISQSNIFLKQNNSLDPETTLYTSFFGINDYSASSTDGNHLPDAAKDYLALVNKLAGPPTNAKYWIAVDDYGRGTDSSIGDAYKNAVFAGLAKTNLTWAFVDLNTLWDGVLTESPGYAAFGYTSAGACTLNSGTVQGACSDPAHTFYWIPGHPSKETHRIMADYIEQVLENCV
jgi:phospholipase/lecithinase/hemolysin